MNSKLSSFLLPIPDIRYRLWSEGALTAIMIMELTWVTAWYYITARPAAGLGVTILVLAGGLLISHWLARFMRAHKWRVALRRVVFLFWLLVYLFVSLKLLLYSQTALSPLELVTQPLRSIFSSQLGDRDFWHFLVLSLLALRGIALSNTPIDQRRVSGSLQLGLLMYLLFGIANSQSHPLATVALLVFYLFISLLGLSAVSIADLSDLRGGKLPRFDSGWAFGIVLASLGVVALAALLGWIVSAKFILQIISEFASWVITVLFFLLALAMVPLLFLIEVVLNLLKDFLFGLIDQKIFKDLTNSLVIQINRQEETIQKSLQVDNALRTIFIVGILFIIFLSIFFTLQARTRRRKLVGEDTSHRIDGRNLKFNFPHFLQTNLTRFSRRQRWLAAAQIRRIYAQLMDLCEKLGQARPAAATPLEFLRTLEMLFPGEGTRLALITQAYLKVRYGELPENAQEVQAVIDAWTHIKSRGRKALVEKKRLDRLVEKK